MGISPAGDSCCYHLVGALCPLLNQCMSSTTLLVNDKLLSDHGLVGTLKLPWVAHSRYCLELGDNLNLSETYREGWVDRYFCV